MSGFGAGGFPLGMKTGYVQKLIFELRYAAGFTYLDKCGRTINAIQADYPEWVLTDPATPQNTALTNVETGTKFNFNSFKYDLVREATLPEDVLTDDAVEAFAKEATALHAHVSERLGLREFTRIGFRVVFVFHAADRQDAEAWLQGLGICNASPKLMNAFDGNMDGMSLAVVVKGKDRCFRISVSTQLLPSEGRADPEVVKDSSSFAKPSRERILQKIGKRKAKQPPYASLVDVDSYLVDPRVIEPSSFIYGGFKEVQKKLQLAVTK